MSTDALRELLVEELAEKLHGIYQQEAGRQDDKRHHDSYSLLPERIKEFDRVLARYILQREGARQAGETEKLPAKGESHDFNSDNQLRHWGDDRTLDLAKIIADLTPMVERFLKREIEAPAAHQYFREEAADKLRKWRKLEAALKADRVGAPTSTK